MPSYDTVIVGASLVTPVGEVQQDLGIKDGKIAAIEPGLAGRGDREIVAEGYFVIPGIIDSHVHLNEPGNTHWEGFETGSKSAVAGGVTCLFEMPLNSLPPTTNVEAFEEKKRLGEQKCRTDFALWGGLIPGNEEDLEPLYDLGVIGFKAFMSDSGLDEFPFVDKEALLKGMKRIATLPGMRLALHAEDDELTRKLSTIRIKEGRVSAADYLSSRPIEAELLAIRTAIDLSGVAGCPIHIVHVSCPEGIELIESAKKAGVDITCETCPHYLSLTDEVILSTGTLAKCAPPLRERNTVEGLWEKVRAGNIDTIGSDHSPCLGDMKAGKDFFRAWGGISGVQHAGAISYTLLHEQLKMPMAAVAALTSYNPSRLFNLPGKGSVSIGMDADLCLADFRNTDPITESELFYRNPHSPYAGMKPTFQVKSTLIRGQTVYGDRRFSDGFRGQFVRPTT